MVQSVLARLWEAFRSWSWDRRALLVVLAPWLVMLAWMWTTGKPRWRTAVAVVGTASMWISFVLAPFAEDTDQTASRGGTTPTTTHIPATSTILEQKSTTTPGPEPAGPGAPLEQASTTTTLPTPATTAEPVGIPPGDDTTVSRVVDGDTIEVAGGERVRLIGVDTPEVYGGAECYGQQASAYTKQLLPVGTAVRLVYDVERLDRYRRTLAYVYRLPDGLFVNAALLRDGYAQVATYPPNVAHVDEFVVLQRQAREAGVGLWSACSGMALTETTVPAPSPSTAGGSSGACDGAYPDVCIPPAPPDLDCGSLSHRRFRVVPPDPHGFDGDGDGMGCESG